MWIQRLKARYLQGVDWLWGSYNGEPRLVKRFYLAMSVLGLLLPFTQFVPWLFEFGLDLPLLLSEALATPISSFAWLDVLVTAMVVIGFIIGDSLRRGLSVLWLPIFGTLLVGPSFGLPLYLYLREAVRH